LSPELVEDPPAELVEDPPAELVRAAKKLVSTKRTRPRAAVAKIPHHSLIGIDSFAELPMQPLV